MVRKAVLAAVVLVPLGWGGLIARAGGPRPPLLRIPILLDTDIGSDIDDAFALALIINSPELDLQGVTTVSGDTQARARLAAKMLWEAGGAWRRVPIAAGEPGKPLPIEQTRWAAGFTSPQLRPKKASDFLKAEFERRPGEITLVTIGPLTNVAALLRQDPAVGRKIRRLAMMGGSIARGYEPSSGPAAEYNIAADPAAAQVLFASGIPILMVPLDVTAMLQLDPVGRDRVFTHRSPVTNSLTLLYHLWGRPTPTLFDPMAVAMLLDPGLCETQAMAIEVDAKGFTRVAEGRPANATVALHTDPAKFFEFYLSRVAPRAPRARM
jgi:inosine-uridine nucleoside N-ribohydrolase